MNPSPETFANNRQRIAREIKDAAKDAAVVLPKRLLDDLIEIVVAECVELRERVSQRIIGQLVGRYDDLDDAKLELLAFVVENHYVDATGAIELAYEPDVIQPTKLRVVN